MLLSSDRMVVAVAATAAAATLDQFQSELLDRRRERLRKHQALARAGKVVLDQERVRPETSTSLGIGSIAAPIAAEYSVDSVGDKHLDRRRIADPSLDQIHDLSGRTHNDMSIER